MPAKRTAVTELADRMVQILEKQRDLGPDAYPLTLRRLNELADAAMSPELALKASAKTSFKNRVIIVRPRNLDSPVALVEDADKLAASSLVLEFVAGLLCTADKPICALSRFKTKLHAKLKLAFEAALLRRIDRNDLPSGIAVVTIKKQKYLHLRRYPLPRAPEVALAEDLLKSLQAQRRLGGDAYPSILSRLVELTRPGADPKLLKKAISQSRFSEQTILALPKQADTPLALAQDRQALADSPQLLEKALSVVRSESNHVATPAELKKKVAVPLQALLEEAIMRRYAGRSWPANIGCLVQKKKPLLFFFSDVAIPPAHTGRPPAVDDFSRAFDEAFHRLDRSRGGHNFVSLVEMRRAVPVDRRTFDSELRSLRVTARYTLSGAEGRHGLSNEEREAGIYEDGSLLLFVSRKSS